MIARFRIMILAGLSVVLGLSCLQVGGLTAQSQGPTRVWTDPNDPTLPLEYKIQGEYSGELPDGGKAGCQVIALGKGALQAVIYPGGLPGDGWDGTNKILMDGRLDVEQAIFKPAAGKRRYLAKSPDAFSATSRFPPTGQKNWSATISGLTMSGTTDEGKSFELRKVFRTSPTLGLKPPAGAIVLFNGSSIDQWTGGRLDRENGILNTDGKDILSNRKLENYSAHLEFMLAYRPNARGQGRGNSGFYQVDHFEVQILDSFGLDGKNNECGGIYTKADPNLNMCYPPLTWQTYDVEFTNAVRDESGKKIKNARITVRHNDVLIHDNVEIDGPTGGHRNEPEGTPGPFKLQGHDNPTQFRNIWIVEKK